MSARLPLMARPPVLRPQSAFRSQDNAAPHRCIGGSKARMRCIAIAPPRPTHDVRMPLLGPPPLSRRPTFRAALDRGAEIVVADPTMPESRSAPSPFEKSRERQEQGHCDKQCVRQFHDRLIRRCGLQTVDEAGVLLAASYVQLLEQRVLRYHVPHQSERRGSIAFHFPTGPKLASIRRAGIQNTVI